MTAHHSKDWSELDASARNLMVAKLLGLELLGQYFIYVDGREFSPTQHGRSGRDKAEGLAAFARGEGWDEFARRNLLPEKWRDTVEARLVEWAIRYSDTPGGGWDVIEELKKRGFSIQIQSRDTGWKVIATILGTETFVETAPTMAEAACLVALRAILPNAELNGAKQPSPADKP